MKAEVYWEDAVVGDERVTPARTVTESDVYNFAALSGSWDPEHVDIEFAKKSPFGQRIAHGLLILAIAEGLRTKMTWYNGDNFRGSNFIAFLGLSNLKYTVPVFFGDTLHCVTKILSKRETSKPERGIIIFQDNVYNQRGEVVAQWERTSMFFRKPNE